MNWADLGASHSAISAKNVMFILSHMGRRAFPTSASPFPSLPRLPSPSPLSSPLLFTPPTFVHFLLSHLHHHLLFFPPLFLILRHTSLLSCPVSRSFFHIHASRQSLTSLLSLFSTTPGGSGRFLRLIVCGLVSFLLLFGLLSHNSFFFLDFPYHSPLSSSTHSLLLTLFNSCG